MVKGYFESRLGDSLFLYRVRLDTLRRWYNAVHGGGSFEQLLQSKLGGKDFGFVMSRLNGVEEGGKRYYPVLNVFYYHKDFKELSGWDGGFVTEALFNWDARGKVVGYTQMGDQVVYEGDSAKLVSEFLSRARWIVEWTIRDSVVNPILGIERWKNCHDYQSCNSVGCIQVCAYCDYYIFGIRIWDKDSEESV